jgi:hypothetical protein
MVDQVYRARKPKASPLWQCLSRHFDAFLAGYEGRYQPRYGFLRPIIPEVVNKFLDCGDLQHGFARVRCDHCKSGCRPETAGAEKHHAKQVLVFLWSAASSLQSALCRLARECLVEYMRATLGLPDGLPGIVMAIHTFGEYMDFHPHLHALAADGLFTRDGKFHVMAEVTLKPL